MHMHGWWYAQAIKDDTCVSSDVAHRQVAVFHSDGGRLDVVSLQKLPELLVEALLLPAPPPAAVVSASVTEA